MSKSTNKRGTKTMKEVKVVRFEFVKDESHSCEARTEEVRDLIAQMIELSHQRGRPKKEEQEVCNAA